MTRLYDPITIARQFLYIRELDGNRGLRVEAIQHWSAGTFGDAWCCEMLWLWFDIAYQGDCPLPRFQSCQGLREFVTQRRWLVDTPARGDLVFSVDDNDHAHHVALCTIDEPLVVIAGNTSADGLSSNGDGVHEHQVTGVGKLYARVPVS